MENLPEKLKEIFWLCAGACLLGALLYLFWLPWVPRLKYANPETTALIQRRQKQAERSGKRLTKQMVWRPLSAISPHLVRAVFLAEDDTFYRHHGFDFEQIKIALRIDWQKKRFAYGGSTLSQQLARTLYLSPSKNLLRKLKEAILTCWLEAVLSKRRILELYLNVAEWGDGVYGAEAAARHHYGKSSADLSPEEAAALASILPSPRKWSPHRETPFMLRRRGDILRRMGFGVRPSTPAASEAEEAPARLGVPEGAEEGTAPAPEPEEEEENGFSPPSVIK